LAADRFAIQLECGGFSNAKIDPPRWNTVTVPDDDTTTATASVSAC
jgi:hypothetical protein